MNKNVKKDKVETLLSAYCLTHIYDMTYYHYYHYYYVYLMVCNQNHAKKKKLSLFKFHYLFNFDQKMKQGIKMNHSTSRHLLPTKTVA